MQKKDIEIYYPKNLTEWRKWLENNHLTQDAVWLVYYKKGSGKASITWSDAVDVALCFGWIDSKKVKINEESSKQFFSKRKPKSTWSKINKRKIQTLMDKGLMTEAGIKSIETAKENGSWTILDEVENLIVPDDLKAALEEKPTAKEFYNSLSKSMRKAILLWITGAKRPETRQNRIAETVERTDQKLKPKHLM